MWKRDHAVKPVDGNPVMPASPTTPNTTPRTAAPATIAAAPEPPTPAVVPVGRSVVINGELSGSEDLTIEGHVEGKIQLKENVLTIGPNGKIKADVFAKAVIVLGEVVGNVTASEKVDIRDNGSVDGDIVSPRVAIAEGAHFRGSVDMQRGGAKPAAASKPTAAQPTPAPQPAAAGQKVGA